MTRDASVNSALPSHLPISAPVLGVVGWSGSGKTTLLEVLLQGLVQQGHVVNAIKHSHHDLQFEAPHKDSARLRQAGASEVLVCSPFRYALVHELRGAAQPGLQQQLARLSPAALTLVEGFKNEAILRLEVHRPQLGHAPLYPHDSQIIAVASDVAAPAQLPARLRWFDLNAPQQIVDWLQQAMQDWPAHMQARQGNCNDNA